MHPIFFEIGPFTIRSYGVLVAVGFFTAFSLLYLEAKKENFYPQQILDLEFLILAFGLIGARALHILVNLDFYAKNPVSIFFIWRGGLAFIGGFGLAILACAVFTARKRLPFWKIADFAAPYMALGHAIGRIGCFFNGCCFGRPAVWPFPGVIFPGEAVYRHPTQLYASFALVCIFVILKLAGERRHARGTIFTLYLSLYSGQRFIIDFLRGDNPTYAFGLTISQFICVFIFAASMYLLVFLRKGNAK